MTARLSTRAVSIANRIHRVTGIARALDPELSQLARKRAVEQVTTPGHRDLDELPESLGWGEVLGWRRFDSTPIAEVVQGWLDSPTHRAIITDPSYPVIGAAMYPGPDEKWHLVALFTTGLVVTP